MGIVLFFSFFALWLFFNWPAIHKLWWTMDDYTLLNTWDYSTIFVFGLKLGRPLSSLWWILVVRVLYQVIHSTLYAGVTIRLIQAGLHVTSSTLIALLLIRFTRRKLSLLAALPFLLWPFGSEVSYVVITGIYVTAALLSLIGVMLCINHHESFFLRPWVGMVLIVAATLTVQSGCMLGITVLWLCVTISLSNNTGWQQFRRPLLQVGAAYVVGAMLSVLLAFWGGEPRLINATLFTPFTTWQLLQLAFYLLTTHPSLYPQWLGIVHMLIFGFSLMSLMFGAIRWKETSSAVLTFFALVCLFVMSYIPLIALGMLWVAGRTMYSSTLVYSAAICVFLQSRLPKAITTPVTLGLLSAMLVGYFPIARTFANMHVINFENDMQTLGKLENFATTHGVSELIVAAFSEREAVNPYNLQYDWFGDSRRSAFLAEWSAQLFIQVSSRVLVNQTDPAALAFCYSYCENLAPRTMTILATPAKAICFCP